MKKRLLIHIGYHKTATTWMQRVLFKPAHGYRQIAEHQEVFDLLVRPHGLTFDPQPVRDLIRTRSAAMATDEVAVISSELLSGNLFYGGRESDEYARRLQLVAPDARILISIRAQLDLLPSVYMQYVRQGGTMPPRAFFEGKPGLGFFGFSEEHWEYDRLTAHYQEIFGRQNVYIFQQEDLSKNINFATERLNSFACNTKFEVLENGSQRREGASEPEYAVPILRRINHLKSSAMHRKPMIDLGATGVLLYRSAGYVLRRPPFPKLFAHYEPISALVQERFAGRFDKSNARLAEICANRIDLSEYY